MSKITLQEQMQATKDGDVALSWAQVITRTKAIAPRKAVDYVRMHAKSSKVAAGLQSSGWMATVPFDAYLRAGPSVYGSVPGAANRPLCYVIANITVTPRYRRQGIFKALLAQMLEAALQDGAALVIENVVNPDLRDYLYSLPDWAISPCGGNTHVHVESRDKANLKLISQQG